MKNERIVISRDRAEPIAENYFCTICGFHRDTPRVKAMKSSGIAARSLIEEQLEPQAIVSSYSGEVLQGNKLVLEGMEFHCNAFEQIEKDQVIAVYAYLVTAGACDPGDVPIMELFYADSWGTAYVDASRDLLTEVLKADSGGVLSDSFGPGFYGMEMSEMRRFFHILDGKQIGVSMIDSGLLLPQKSCAGIYIAVKEGTELPQESCRECVANTNGCQFCRMRPEGLHREAPNRG